MKIRDIYEGNTKEIEKMCVREDAYRYAKARYDVFKEIFETRLNKMLENMSEKENRHIKTEFEDFINSAEQFLEQVGKENYICGFRAGVRLMCDSLYRERNDKYDCRLYEE